MRAVSLVVAVGAGLLAGCGESEPARTVGRAAPAALSGCSATSWVGGITELCGGRLVYRDYVYDDYGADARRRNNPLPDGTLTRAAGDQAYPAGMENTADIVRLELWLEGGELVAEVELNTLYEPDQTRVVIGLDSDALPDPAAPFTVPYARPNWDTVLVLERGDPATNLMRARFPRPPGTHWGLWAYAQQAASGTVMNVAFRGTDEEAGSNASPNGLGLDQGNFWEDKQARALRDGDIGAFTVSVAVADLEQGVTRPAVVPPGFHQGVYTSAYTLSQGPGPTLQGEGVSVAGVPGRHGDNPNTTCEQYFNFLGKYQAYGLYLPAQPGPHALQFVLHGCASSNSGLINQAGMQAHLGDEPNRIIVVPQGRGPVGYYSDISERDVLDVLADVSAHYDVDEERVIIGGYSMGGYGALRFAAFYPDLFAAATNWVGFTGNVSNNPATAEPPMDAVSGGIGNVIDFVANLRHIPIVNMYGAGDELVQVNTALALRQRLLDDTEVVHDFYLHPNAEHLTFAVLDHWRREAAYSEGRRRVRQPARVTYLTDPALDYPEYGIVHDRAYWVSGITGRAVNAVWDEPTDYVDVDLTSFGCGHPVPVFEAGQENGAGPPPLTWNRQFRIVAGEIPAPRENRIVARLRNVASLTVDVAGACLDFGPLAYEVEADGPGEIRFSDGRVLRIGADGVFTGTL